MRRTRNAKIVATLGNTPDAVCCALRRITGVLGVPVTVSYTSSGYTSLRAARERPEAPILSLTPHLSTARRLAPVWGLHSVVTKNVATVDEMTETACRIAVSERFAAPGQTLVIAAGVPFGKRGATNLIRVATVEPEHQ
jgi:pyruvate kinase